MSIIITDGTGYAEKELLDNWAAEYAKRELNKHREAAIIDHPDNSISGEKIIDGAISNAKLASNAVATKNIQSGAITSDKIGSGAVTTEKLAGDAVTADKLADNAVATANIQVHAVTTDRLAYKSVTTNELSDKAVTTRTLADKCVTNYQMGDNAVETYAIKDKAVTNDKIANDTVKSFNLAPNAVQTNKIEDGAVTTAKIANGAVITDKIADYSVTQMKLAQGAVDTRTIADAAVTADKLSEKYIKAKESTILDQEFPDGDYSTIIYRIEDSYEDPNKGLTETCSHYILSGVKDDEPVWKKILTGTISSENTSFCGYSTTPVQVGTWIDGTPIWRKAFDTTLTELNISDGVWNLGGLVKSAANLKAIINSYVYTQIKNDYATDIRLREEDTGSTSRPACNPRNFVLPSNSEAGDIVRGYVDFVAEEDDVDFS